jgi:hypothetical protein
MGLSEPGNLYTDLRKLIPTPRLKHSGQAPTLPLATIKVVQRKGRAAHATSLLRKASKLSQRSTPLASLLQDA